MPKQLLKGGSGAATSGMKFRDYVETIVATSNAHASGMTAGTSFAWMLRDLLKPTSDAKKAMLEFAGVDLFEDGKLKGAGGIAKELRKIVASAGVSQETLNQLVSAPPEAMENFIKALPKENKLKSMFEAMGSTAAKSALPLLAMTDKEFEKIAEKMDNLDLDKLAKMAMEGYSGATRELQSARDDLKISLFGDETTGGVFENLVRKLTKQVQKLTEYIDENSDEIREKLNKIIESIMAFLSGIKTAFSYASMVLGTVVNIISKLTGETSGASDVLNTMLTVLGLVAGAYLILTPILLASSVVTKLLTAAHVALRIAMLATSLVSKKVLFTAIVGLGGVFAGLASIIKVSLIGAFKALRIAMFATALIGKNVLFFAMMGLGKLFSGLVFIIKGALIGAFRALNVVFKAFVMIGRALMANPIMLLIMAVAAGAYLIYKNWEPTKEFFTKLWNDISSNGIYAWELFQIALEGTIQFLKDKFNGFINVFLSGVNKLIEASNSLGTNFEKLELRPISSDTGGAIDTSLQVKKAKAALKAGKEITPWEQRLVSAYEATNNLPTGNIGNQQGGMGAVQPMNQAPVKVELTINNKAKDDIDIQTENLGVSQSVKPASIRW